MTGSSPMYVVKKSPGLWNWSDVGQEEPARGEDPAQLLLVELLVGEDRSVDEATLRVHQPGDVDRRSQRGRALEPAARGARGAGPGDVRGRRGRGVGFAGRRHAATLGGCSRSLNAMCRPAAHALVLQDTSAESRSVLAAVAISQDPTDPLSGLELQDVPIPEAAPGWSRVQVVASSLNMHDLWTLRGVGHPAEQLPRILGCDAVGYDEAGRRVVVYPVIASPDRGHGDETLDPQRALLSEQHDGAFAEYLTVPTRNLLPVPDELSLDEAACLPVAWGTAYRMLFTQARIRAGDRVLVQGAGGGVASAAIKLALGAGAVVYATSRSEAKLALAEEWGARGSLDRRPPARAGRRGHRDCR